MRILVTGHKGYIGTVMVPMLIAAGHEVVGLDSDIYARCTFGNPIPEIPQIKKDIRDVQSSDLEGFEAVIHLAALSNDPLGNLNPKLTHEINCVATKHLASLAKAMGVTRFIFSSSCSIYGAAGEKAIDERAPLQPLTPYGISKSRAEQGLMQLADADFSPTFLRSATAYGVSPRLRFDLVLNNLAAWPVTTGYIYLKSDGSPWRPIVHIEDLSRAFMKVINAPREKVHNQAFNVGTTKDNFRIHELAEIVQEIIPHTRIKYAEGAGPDQRCYRVDCGKLTRIFSSFRAHWDPRKGVKQLYETYRQFSLAAEDFEGPLYSRIDHIKYLLSMGQLDASLRWNASKI